MTVQNGNTTREKQKKQREEEIQINLYLCSAY